MSQSNQNPPHYENYKTYILMIGLEPNGEFTLEIVNDPSCVGELTDDEISALLLANFRDGTKSVRTTPLDFSVRRQQNVLMVFHIKIPYWPLTDRKLPIEIEASSSGPSDLRQFSERRFLKSALHPKHNRYTFITRNANSMKTKHKYIINFLYERDGFSMPIEIDPEIENDGDGN